MSRLAQAVQREVAEMRRAVPRRRKVMDGDERAGGLPADTEEMVLTDEESAVPQAATTAVTTGDGDMSKKKTRKAGKAMRSKATRQAKRSRTPRAASGHGRTLKAYRLVNGIPEALRNPSAGRSILEAIEKRGSATGNEIRGDLPKMPTPTVGFYLGKFQRENIVSAK